MPGLKGKDLRALSVDELEEKAESLRKELFQLRWEAKLAKLQNLSRLRHARRDLARVLTVCREMEQKKNG
ncbi:MAG: 50S ribosomal protein L29 [Omnitrophica bacterium RIFCSPLOWO2_12_FULL_50_11]|nr:MAG: 50S ribosomal protein L29 [Omnitrophica bacterium RIFCSPLOWO2_12_FULL_50_11]